MTGPREWRHAEGCPKGRGGLRCNCGLSAVRDAIAFGHRVVIGPDGVEGPSPKIDLFDGPVFDAIKASLEHEGQTMYAGTLTRILNHLEIAGYHIVPLEEP